MKLLRVIYDLTDKASTYQILEYEVLKVGHKVYVLRYETSGQKTRHIPKEDIAVVRYSIDFHRTCASAWCFEADLEEIKVAIKEKLEKAIDEKLKSLDRQIPHFEGLGVVLGTTPTEKRMTYEDWIN